MEFSIKEKISVTVLLILISYFPIFHQLGDKCIYQWDEARGANNAIEMYETGDLLVTTYDGIPDHYNSKPPLSVWAQYVSLKIFGISEFSIRFHSAIAALFTLLLIIYFAYKVFDSLVIAIFSGLILISSRGYIVNHIVRTGEQDSLLVFFVTLYLLSYFCFLSYYPQKKTKYILLFSLGVILAGYTKSISGFIPLIGMVAYTFSSKTSRKIIFDPIIYKAIFGILAIYITYYLVREIYDPGYIKNGLGLELSLYKGRSAWKHPSPFFYLKYLYTIGINPYIYFLPIAIFLGIRSKNRVIKSFTIYCLYFLFFYILIYSIGNTRNQWYIAAIYPAFAILTAIGVHELVLIGQSKISYLKNKSVFYFVLIIIGAVSIQKNYRLILKDHKPKYKHIYHYHKEGAGMKWFQEHNPEITRYSILTEDRPSIHKGTFKFYMKAYKLKYDYEIDTPLLNEININDTILSCVKEMKDSIHQKFIVDTLEIFEECELVKVNGYKSNPVSNSL